MYTQLRESEFSMFPYYKAPKAGEMLTEFEGMSRMVMLDRYAMKDLTLSTLKEGDVVLVTIVAKKKYPEVGYGTVKSLNADGTVTIKLQFPESVSTGENPDSITRPRSAIVKPVEIYWEQIAHRVAKVVAEVEKPELQDLWYGRFYWLIKNCYLIPGGRINYGAGNGDAATLFNCYVVPSPQDSRQGIMEHAARITEIMARGGGVGTNVSTLRPADTPVEGINGFSSGSVSWAGWLSSLTHLIRQGGTRNGAQMIMMNDWHPDVIEFALCKIQRPQILELIISEIDDEYIKSVAESYIVRDSSGKAVGVRDPDFMTGANISILVSDAFMEAALNGGTWDLKYPDLKALTPEQKKYYDRNWHKLGGIEKWEEQGLPVKVYRTINAAAFYHMLMICARYSAEPGMVFKDTYNREANSWYYTDIICTNPCGEQGLPAWGVCNLSAINMEAMYDPATNDVNWELFEKVLHYSQRFCDNVTDANHYFFEENKEQAKMERRNGKGAFAIADLFIRMGLRYGSPEMLAKLDQIMGFFAKHSYLAAADIAAEKGSFPAFDADKFLQSGYMKRLCAAFPEVEKAIREKGCRNVTSITMAPTGSTGTMVGKATGIEPYFAFKYYRTSRFGEFIEQNVKIAQDWLDAHPGEKLPDYFVSAMELTPEEHVMVQATIQKWVDSSLSKTVNAPRTFTVEDTKKLYTLAYKSGCKGVTIYVDGSRDTQVLNLVKDNEESVEDSESKKDNVVAFKVEREEEETPIDMESTKLCTITYDHAGNRIVECH